MRVVSREVIEYAMDNAGMSTERLRPNYSGRAMYGAECFGIIVESLSDAFAFFAQLGIIAAQNEENTAIEDTDYFDTGAVELLAARASSDSMGIDTIVYFPGWALA